MDTLQTQYPVMPLKNTVLFPQQVIPIYVGRKKSLQLIDDLDPENKYLVVVAQHLRLQVWVTEIEHNTHLVQVHDEVVVGRFAVPRLVLCRRDDVVAELQEGWQEVVQPLGRHDLLAELFQV